MAKKDKTVREVPQALLQGMSGKEDRLMNDYNGMRRMLMSAMAAMGVTPEEYASFLGSDKSFDDHRDQFLSMAEDLGISDNMDFDVPEAHAIPDADKKSLRLKIQMKGVTKPPMWREVIIPADFNFSQLHHVIQTVTDLYNEHLWEFREEAYDTGIIIGVPMLDPLGFGLDDWTHDSDKTPVTAFLAKKGDKLEYVYDFGDDWIFTVSVLDLMDRQGDVAVCTKWKCDIQPVENSGGPWAYMEMREVFTDPDKLSAKQKKDTARILGFDSFKDLKANMDEFVIDIEYVNERLTDIPESGLIDD